MKREQYVDPAHRKAAAKSRRRTERLKAERRCYRCGDQLPDASVQGRCEACATRDLSTNRMRAIRATQTDAERTAKNKADREYYAKKRADQKWREDRWERNALTDIKRRFNFDGGDEWAEIAKQLRLVRRAIGKGFKGRPPLRGASLSLSEALTQPFSLKE